MKDCHSDMLAFHDERVTLSTAARNEMRTRRNSNRKRLEKGLERDEEPQPRMLKSQGSYAMWTMVQYKAKDYDIDDGVYFAKDELKGPKGGDRTPLAAKEMVKKAGHDDSFKKPPDVRANCVRVYYDAGYHVDVPVYRIVEEEGAPAATESYELASSEWKSSDPAEVTNWFSKENQSQSPNKENGGQLRRITRLLKTFARSRDSWNTRIATGFMITKLVVEKYQVNDAREDTSLYDTMRSIRDRLKTNLEVDHPVVSGEKLTKGPDDARTRFLREKLSEAIDTLDVLFDPDCTTAESRKAWDKAFNTDFFRNRPTDGGGSDGNGGKGTSAGILIKDGEDSAVRDAVDKRGGGTYARAAGH